MSWDVVMVRTKTNAEALKDVAGENIVPFTQTEIAEAVKNAAPRSAHLTTARICHISISAAAGGR